MYQSSLRASHQTAYRGMSTANGIRAYEKERSKWSEHGPKEPPELDESHVKGRQKR